MLIEYMPAIHNPEFGLNIPIILEATEENRSKMAKTVIFT
jgi:hypothetical protein